MGSNVSVSRPLHRAAKQIHGQKQQMGSVLLYSLHKSQQFKEGFDPRIELAFIQA